MSDRHFDILVGSILDTHAYCHQSAAKAINLHLTVRNWLIGYQIVEYEQNGDDRAKYGGKLLGTLAKKLQESKLANTNERELRRYRLFYQVYPQLAEVFLQESMLSPIRGTVSPELALVIKRATLSPESLPVCSSANLVIKLSFSHLAELVAIEEPGKRGFYEMECVKGNWSVRELRRQINSLYFERSGLSKNPENLANIISQTAENLRPEDIIKSVYTFEFLGLRPKDVIEETDLEKALLDHLQEFMLELGYGFCLEARQKKILIGDRNYFIDLVFYHRILKCHVLIELKVDEFTHNNAGQLNTYLSFYKKQVVEQDDNPPIGILLVTNHDKTLVEYATAGMDNRLFVSKYMVELPAKEQLEQFVKEELKKL